MQPKAKKIIFIAVLLTGCIITSLISTNDKAKTLPGGSSLLQSAQSAVTSKAAQAKTVRVQVSGAVLEREFMMCLPAAEWKRPLLLPAV